MNDAVTFFRDRDNDSGETYQIDLEGPRETTRIFVYAQRAFESRALQNQAVSTLKDVELTLRDLRSALTSAGGGVIVTVNDEARSRTFTATKVNAKPYQAPERCCVVMPGQPPAQLDTNGVRGKFPAGSHLLVPVNPDAEGRLREFVAHLSWLSPDLESVVLHAIRRPSLDRRLDVVESQVFASRGDRPLVTGKAAGLLTVAIPPPVIRVALAVVMVLLISANAMLVYTLRPRTDDETFSLGSTTSPKKAAAEPFAEEAKTLFEAIRAKEQKDPVLHQLAAKHFSGLEGAVWKEEPRFLLGLIKLQLLAFIANPEPDEEFLKSENEIAATNQVYETAKAAIAKDSKASQLLTALACRFDSKLAFRADCTNVSPGAIEQGLHELTEYVEGRP